MLGPLRGKKDANDTLKPVSKQTASSQVQRAARLGVRNFATRCRKVRSACTSSRPSWPFGLPLYDRTSDKEAERGRLERERLERLEKARVGRLLAQARALREAQEIRAYVSAVRDLQSTLENPLSEAGFKTGQTGTRPGGSDRPGSVWQLQDDSTRRLRQTNGGLYWRRQRLLRWPRRMLEDPRPSG